MIQLLIQYKSIILLNVILIYFLHTLVVKPLLAIRHYVKQGVQHWGYYSILGPSQFIKNEKANDDALYAEKLRHHTQKGIINASVSNILSTPSLVLYDPQLIRDFYVNKNQYYVKSTLGATLTDVVFGKGLIFSEGEQWKKARKIASKLFTFDLVINYIPLINEITYSKMNNIKIGEKIDIIQFLESITGTFSLSIFFGRTLEGEVFHGKPLVDYIKETEISILEGSRNPLFLLSGGKYISTNLKSKANEIKEKMRSLVKQELQDQIKMNKNSLIMLYAKEYNYIGGELPKDLLQDLTNQIINFYVAGRDTTSLLTTMILYYIAKDDSLREKLLNEFGNKNGLIQWDDIKSLPIMDAVINETSRIFGPGIGLFQREATETHKIGNITVTKGTYVQIGILANNYNPDRFPDPFTFNYERWLNKNPITDQYQFIPFSAGARNCIGQHLAKITTKIMVLNLLRKYKIQVDPEYKLQFVSLLTYAPKSPIKFIFDRI